MDLNEFIEIAGSKDFGKRVKELKDRLDSAVAAERSLAGVRNALDRRREELDTLETSLKSKKRSLDTRERNLTKAQAALGERQEALSKAETAVQEREKLAGQKESAAKEKMGRAEKLMEANERDRQTLERRLSYLDKIPA